MKLKSLTRKKGNIVAKLVTEGGTVVEIEKPADKFESLAELEEELTRTVKLDLKQQLELTLSKN